MIDSSLFGVDLPAGTYTQGDIVELGIVDGPATVRSGRGAAILKRITVGEVLDATAAPGSETTWKIFVKNSDWIDPAVSITSPLRNPTMLDEKSGCIQRGHDCPLTPNSSWTVYAECIFGATTTVANSLFALIDIDYPSVSSIVDPDALPGVPATINMVTGTINLKAAGSLTSSSAQYVNVDIFKAGNEYALEKVEIVGRSNSAVGFLSISNAAGMQGLKRIMPMGSLVYAIRNKVEYASKLVKGPMDIGFNLFSSTGTAATSTIDLFLDFVKRKV